MMTPMQTTTSERAAEIHTRDPAIWVARLGQNEPEVGDVIHIDGGEGAGDYDVKDIEDHGASLLITLSRRPDRAGVAA